MKTVEQIRAAIGARKNRNAWQRGVALYINDLLEELEYFFDSNIDGITPEQVTTREQVMDIMLNGAKDWHDYSWGGCSLIYNSDIAERLCTPSELKKRHYGDYRPNRNEEWLDVQARALKKAAFLISLYA